MRCKRLTFNWIKRRNFLALQSNIYILALLMVIASALGVTKASGASSQNAQSPLGIEVSGISYYSPEMPFLNIFKSNSGWITNSPSTWDTGEEKYLNLDADGWPISLVAKNEPSTQQFNSLVVLFQNALPKTASGYYPGGQYFVLYDGQGTMTYSSDAALVSRSVGQDIINVATPSSSGILLRITATDPNHSGNYLRNIRLVRAQNAAALSSGQIFNPTFIGLMQNFRMLRFMDWLMTNDNTLSSWSNRPLQSNAFWGSPNGAPIEVAVQLANAVSADAWLNVPVMADDNYVTQMATLVHSQLGKTQKVYVEFSNEVWNSIFTQYRYAITQGQSVFASGLGSEFDYNRNWYGMRVAQTCDIWKSVWGSDASRVVCVLASQAANTSTATEALSCSFWTAGTPCSGHGIGAVAIAPYFGGTLPSAWTSQSDGGLSNLFASLSSQNDPSIPVGGWFNQVAGWEKSYIAMLAPYHLPLVAYEGGQSFVGGGALGNLYTAANRDPRMGPAYTTYFQQWKANGGQLFNDFADITGYGQYGSWGALESIMQTTNPITSAPPKWQAIQNFISGGCWWSGCTAGSLSATPMAPSNLTVH
jgi:hypothetical protein